MKIEDYVRANEFDRWVGKLQTEKVIELGVGNSILDIGCGIGQFTPMFTKKWKRVVGLDPDLMCLQTARTAGLKNKVEYIEGWGETFDLNERFDTITMNNLLEHVESPVKVLQNCKRHLSTDGVIIVQVPNRESVARQLGVLMGVIPSLDDNSKREQELYGHRRTYSLETILGEVTQAGLKSIKWGGILYKPLPNEMLYELSQKYGEYWTNRFIKALVKYGEDKPGDCAQLYVVCA